MEMGDGKTSTSQDQDYVMISKAGIYLEPECLVSCFSKLSSKKKRRDREYQYNPKEGLVFVLFFFSFPLESSCQFYLSQNTVRDEHD